MQSLTRLALLIFLSTRVYSQLTPWDNQLFDFGWSPYPPTLNRCSLIQVGWTERATSNPHSQAPYTLTALYGGNIPLDIGTSSTNAYNWTVQLPTGGPYIMTMRDANGYTGGDSLVFNVVDATSGTCGISSFTANTLQVTSTGTLAECSDIVLTAQGGSAPYTMKIMAGERPAKTSTWTTSTMAYTIDMQPSEQFFVLITDANGNTALDGIHTVAAGDSSCYGVASTVTVASVATTLSYDPSRTTSYPPRTSTSDSGASSAHSTSSRTVMNTGSETITTTLTLADGSKTVAVLPPGDTLTVPEDVTSNSSSKNNNLPAIVGGAVGGVALIVIVLLACFFQRRNAAQKRRLQEQLDAYEGRRPTLPMTATTIQPYSIPGHHTPTPEHAPLMSQMSSYSASPAPAPLPTPTPSSHSYFGNSTAYGGTAPWANPEVNYQPQTAYAVPASPQPSGSSRPMSSITSPSTSGAEGLPPGAMAPIRSGSIHALANEKATFRPAERPQPVAPPPYSHS